VFAPAGPQVKRVFPTGWCAADNGWENGTVDISYVSLTEILSSCRRLQHTTETSMKVGFITTCSEPDIHARLSCLSCMQTSFQLMPAMLTNRRTAEFCSVRELW